MVVVATGKIAGLDSRVLDSSVVVTPGTMVLAVLAVRVVVIDVSTGSVPSTVIASRFLFTLLSSSTFTIPAISDRPPMDTAIALVANRLRSRFKLGALVSSIIISGVSNSYLLFMLNIIYYLCLFVNNIRKHLAALFTPVTTDCVRVGICYNIMIDTLF